MPAVTGLVRRHLSYANVAATLAVVLALGGTAYAAGLPKNSVGSKQIKKSAVKSADIKNDAVRGPDIKESTLTQVPDAAALGGVAASGYLQRPLSVSGGFLAGQELEIAVPGYGTFGLVCNGNGTPATSNDDFAQYRVSNGLGTDPRQGVVITASAGPLVDAVVRMPNGDGSNTGSTFGHSDNRMAVRATHESADGARVVEVVAHGFDDATTNGCRGSVQVQVLK